MKKSEQETVISFMADDKTANIFSTDPSVIKKFTKKDVESIDIDVPKKNITITGINAL